ncbi:MAG: hypothetical protein NVSMB46_05930 [Candidatus Saccharimonadales bacterium]
MAKVLIIEDTEIINNAYRMILERAGYEVRSAYDGKEGLAIAQTYTPDIILLDLLMPHLDGIGFLKAYHSTADVKIIVLSNLGDNKQVEVALSLGADKYMLKSDILPNQLIEVVGAYAQPS